MSYHQRLTLNALPIGPERTEAIEQLLAAERRVARTEPAGSYNARIADGNVADLERALEQSRRNDAARADLEARIDHQRQEERQRVDARRQASEDALKATLRSQFLAANLSATDADFERLYPRLRDEHLLAERDAAEARQRAAVRGRLGL